MSSTKALSPRESAELITSKSEDVSICEEGIEEASKIIFDCLKSKKYSCKTWKQHELHPNEMRNETVDWIVVLDTLNFCFWSDDGVEPWTVRYEGKNYTGYWALCASIHRALKVCWNLYKVAHFRQHWQQRNEPFCLCSKQIALTLLLSFQWKAFLSASFCCSNFSIPCSRNKFGIENFRHRWLLVVGIYRRNLIYQ